MTKLCLKQVPGLTQNIIFIEKTFNDQSYVEISVKFMFLVRNDTLVSDPYSIWIETDRVIFDISVNFT